MSHYRVYLKTPTSVISATVESDTAPEWVRVSLPLVPGQAYGGGVNKPTLLVLQVGEAQFRGDDVVGWGPAAKIERDAP